MNRTFLCFLLTFNYIGSVFPQDTTYYYSANNIPSDPGHAVVKQVMTMSSANRYKVSLFARTEKHWEPVSNLTVRIRDEDEYQIREFRKGNLIKSYTRYYSPTSSGSYNFVEVRHRDTIRTGTSTTRLPLTLDGVETEYYPGGQIRSESVYKNNRLMSNKNWLANGERYVDDVYYSVSSYPEYKPGTKFLHKYLLEYIRQSGLNIDNLDGMIRIGFVVTDSGTVEGVHVVQGILPKYDKVVAEAVGSLPGDWQPAELDNKNVNCYLTIPVNFMNRSSTDYQYLDISYSAFTFSIFW